MRWICFVALARRSKLRLYDPAVALPVSTFIGTFISVR
jgi:hypothetical protein